MFSLKFLFPKNEYEKRAIRNAFILFFLTIQLLTSVVFLLLLKIELENKKRNIYLKLINYSYTFSGKDFQVSLQKLSSNSKNEFYILKEDEEGLFIVIPIPGVKGEGLKITYPKEKFNKDLQNIIKSLLLNFGIFSLVNIFMSYILALYTVAPLREAINLITEVSRDIAHDMNTPLTSLLINLNILKERYDKEAIKRMEIAVNQLKYLRENLAPLERKISLKLEETNLKEIIEEILKEYKEIYTSIKVEKDLDDVKVLVDSNTVRRIFDNILSNAFKHNVKNGWVKVILRKGVFVVENPSNPLKNPDRVFERFYRESDRGTGLGLSVVKKLCDELGWKVKAYYENGVFRIKVEF